MKKTAVGVAAFLAAVVASSCSGSPAGVLILSEEELKQESAENLYTAWALFGHSRVRDELERRGAITPAEWQLIEKEEVEPGMSELALLCSWGSPDDSATTRNQSMGQRGEQKTVRLSPTVFENAHRLY